jgi:hypothetical protein
LGGSLGLSGSPRGEFFFDLFFGTKESFSMFFFNLTYLCTVQFNIPLDEEAGDLTVCRSAAESYDLLLHCTAESYTLKSF